MDCGIDLSLCKEVKGVPTWEINGVKYTGYKSLEELKQLSGCGVPVEGLYAKIGEEFTLSINQPVKIVDYIDSHANPLKITLLSINPICHPKEPCPTVIPYAQVKAEFSGETEVRKITTGSEINLFGVVLRTISVDNIAPGSVTLVVKKPGVMYCEPNVEYHFTNKCKCPEGTNLVWLSRSVFVCKKEEIVHARLGQAFELKPKQIAKLMDYRVLTMRLDSIVSSENKKAAIITVWPTYERVTLVKEEPITEKATMRPVTATAGKVVTGVKVVPSITKPVESPPIVPRQYQVLEGESVNVFGVRMMVKELTERSAVFVITKQTPWTSCDQACKQKGYAGGHCSSACTGVSIGEEFCPQPVFEAKEETPPLPPVLSCCCQPEEETIKIVIHKGWNLFSMPGEIRPVSEKCDSRNWRVFEYNRETRKFEAVKWPEIGKAYWLYADKPCTAEVRISKPVLLEELEGILPGWNLVPVVPDMIGKSLEELSDCTGLKVYTYDTSSRKWIKVDKITEEFYGRGLAVKSELKCSFNTLPSIPPFPEE